jgi:hypothetical protein
VQFIGQVEQNQTDFAFFLHMAIYDYFRTPFPSREGFSAYRFPGLAAHIPLFFIFALTGILLCGPSLMLLVWFVAGLYLGRDIAISCHYAPLLLLVIWGMMFGLSSAARTVSQFGRQHPGAGLLLTALILAAQVGVAWRMTRTE